MNHRRRHEIIDRDPGSGRPMMTCRTCSQWKSHAANNQCFACYMANKRAGGEGLREAVDGLFGPRLIPAERNHTRAAFTAVTKIWEGLYELGVPRHQQEAFDAVIRDYLKPVYKTGNGIEVGRSIEIRPEPRSQDNDGQTPRHRKARRKVFDAFRKVWTGVIDLGVRQDDRRKCYQIIRSQLGSLADDFADRDPDRPELTVSVNTPSLVNLLTGDLASRNQVFRGDAWEVVPLLGKKSVNAVITSPPYAEQRRQYPGIRADEYPERFANLMTSLDDTVTDDGSVIVVISPHVAKGQLNDYVHRLILAVGERGWYEPLDLYWDKRNSPPTGSKLKPRRIMDRILWFAKKGRRPFVDAKACGRFTNRLGLVSPNRHGNFDGTSVPKDGIARIPNVFRVPASLVDRDIKHPAMYPRELARQLILTFTPESPDSTILDMFVGSGTTCLVAQQLGYRFIGIDVHKPYADMTAARVQAESK